MFTGIIEEVGTVERTGAKLTVRCREVVKGVKAGDSIAVNGVCLTAVTFGATSFTADVSPETLSRSNLGSLKPGDPVNLERPLSPSSRLGGHIVQGHIDATGELVSLEQLGDDNWWLSVRFPGELSLYIVSKGSVAIDGMSLTVARVEDDVLAVTIIPHTYGNTNLSSRRPGDKLNLEADVLAKYVERMLAAYTGATAPKSASKLDLGRLAELGY